MAVDIEQISHIDKDIIKFKDKSSIILCAPTGGGKSCLISKILLHKERMFCNVPTKVLYCYRFYQSIFDTLQKQINGIDFHLGLPSQTEIDNFSTLNEHRLIVIDDLATELVNSTVIENLVTSACHHRNLSSIIVLQNLFPKGSVVRTLLLNCTYTILFENNRDQHQVKLLGSRLYPGKSHNFLEIYNDACVKRKYGYLLIDSSSNIDNNYRLRTNILPDEMYTIIYEI